MGESSRASLDDRGAEEGPDQALEITHGYNTVRHGLLQEEASTLGRLRVELADVDTRLEAEGLPLAREWCQLGVAMNFGRLQHEHARAEVEESLTAARKARDRALKEARVADHRREVAEESVKELQASNTASSDRSRCARPPLWF